MSKRTLDPIDPNAGYNMTQAAEHFNITERTFKRNFVESGLIAVAENGHTCQTIGRELLRWTEQNMERKEPATTNDSEG